MARTGPAPERDEGLERDEFVGFRLGDVGFIMRRAPFFAAVHRTADDSILRAAPSSSPQAGRPPRTADYIDSALRYNDLDVPMLRLDDLLRDLFRIEEPARLRVGLIAKAGSFGPAFEESFRAIVRKNLPGADEERIALGIGGEGSIRSIPWADLRPPPRSLRSFLWSRGIAACRFDEAGRAEFVIDPAGISFPGVAISEANR